MTQPSTLAVGTSVVVLKTHKILMFLIGSLIFLLAASSVLFFKVRARPLEEDKVTKHQRKHISTRKDPIHESYPSFEFKYIPEHISIEYTKSISMVNREKVKSDTISKLTSPAPKRSQKTFVADTAASLEEESTSISMPKNVEYTVVVEESISDDLIEIDSEYTSISDEIDIIDEPLNILPSVNFPTVNVQEEPHAANSNSLNIPFAENFAFMHSVEGVAESTNHTQRPSTLSEEIIENDEYAILPREIQSLSTTKAISNETILDNGSSIPAAQIQPFPTSNSLAEEIIESDTLVMKPKTIEPQLEIDYTVSPEISTKNKSVVESAPSSANYTRQNDGFDDYPDIDFVPFIQPVENITMDVVDRRTIARYEQVEEQEISVSEPDFLDSNEFDLDFIEESFSFDSSDLDESEDDYLIFSSFESMADYLEWTPGNNKYNDINL